MSDAPHHDQLALLLQQLGYGESAAHLHGQLCGALCAVEPAQISEESLLDDVQPPSEPLDDRIRGELRALINETASDLLSNDLVFEPLLPSDAAPLAQRVDALAQWCDGFLFGVSSRRQLDVRALSAEAREALRDFTQLTQAGVDDQAEAESQEASYTELVEFVRVGAQLLFLELRPRPSTAEAASSTVH